MEKLHEIAPITSNQPMYSMLERKVEKDVLPWAEKHNSGVVVYSPMHSGLLTGKISAEWLEKLPQNDWRNHKSDHPVVSPLHSKDGLQAFLILQDELKLIADEKSMTVGQLAVSWALSQPMVTSAIVGARKSGQILETVEASGKILSLDEKNLIMKHIINFERKLNHG